MTATNQIIKPTDAESATYRTDIKGWVSRHGRYFGDGEQGERSARFDGCTHGICRKCQKPTEGKQLICNPCWRAEQHETWLALPAVEYQDQPLTFQDGDQYFFDLDDLECYCDNHEIKPEELDLVIAEARGLRQVSEDYWDDELPEDGELPKPIQDALEALNSAIRDHGRSVAYWPSKTRLAALPPDFLCSFYDRDGA